MDLLPKVGHMISSFASVSALPGQLLPCADYERLHPQYGTHVCSHTGRDVENSPSYDEVVGKAIKKSK